MRVPNAASYLAQKLLVRGKRKPADRAKDILYIHDTLDLFAGSLEAISQQWRKDVRPALFPRARHFLRRAATALFGEVTEPIVEAERQAKAAGRSLTAETILAVCRHGLEAVFE